MNVFRIVVGFGVLAGILLFSYHLYKDTVSNYGRVEGDKAGNLPVSWHDGL